MTARALVAEIVGTFCLVMAIAGAALFAAPLVGLLAVALAAGMAMVAMTYAVGHISGAHFNPAVTLGLIAAGRFDSARAPGYIIAQVLGGAAAGLVLWLVASGALVGVKLNSFAAVSNHYGGPGQYTLMATFLLEVVATALLLIVVVGATSRRAHAGFAPLAIGLALAVLYIVTIPVTNASLNPARSTATALFGGTVPLSQLWLFWVAPIVGGLIGGVIARYLQEE